MPYNYQPYQQNQVFMQQPQMGQGYSPPIPDRLMQARQGYEQYPPQMGYGQPMQQQNPSLIKVLSEAEAQSYPVAFGASVAMLDTQRPMLYIKSVDTNGLPDFKKFRLTEEQDMPVQQMQDMNEKYVTREEYNDLCREHERVMDAITRIAERMGVNDEHEQSGT